LRSIKIENILNIETGFFFSVEILKVKTFQSRLGCVKIFIEIVETNQDCQDLLRLSRFLDINGDILDFRHLWKVVGEDFTLILLSSPWVTF
jgi:hypothetical protein